MQESVNSKEDKYNIKIIEEQDSEMEDKRLNEL